MIKSDVSNVRNKDRADRAADKTAGKDCMLKSLHREDLPTITRLEEAGLNGFSGLIKLVRDGWIYQASNGYGNRANSVLPLYEGTEALEHKVDMAEAFCRKHQLKPTFKMTDASKPENLDQLLEARGYARIRDTSIQLLDLHTGSYSMKPDQEQEQDKDNNKTEGEVDESSFDPAVSQKILCWEANKSFWQDMFKTFNHMSETDLTIYSAILDQSPAEVTGCVVYKGAEVAAFGLGVYQEEYFGLYNIFTNTAYRRQGFGSQIVTGLIGLARKSGCRWCYLQVMKNNPPAMELYKKCGFTEQYDYWYRKKE